MTTKADRKPSPVRVANWWFWQGVIPFALNLDQVVVIDSDAVYLDLVDSGSFALTEEMRQALESSMKEYLLWKATRSAEFAAFKEQKAKEAAGLGPLDSKEFIPHE